MPSQRSITILGATGSVGMSTIDLVKREPGRFRVEAVTARRNATALAKIAIEVGARLAVVADADFYDELKGALAGSGIEAAAGEAAIVDAAQRPADWVMAAISGAVGLKPTLAAIERGATVGLANKECLVCAGAFFMRRAAATGATVLPVDSEHNAVFQALGAGPREDVKRVILTASGGPFRTWTIEQIKAATPEQALRHPNWSMGPKITIDSASLMNKGLELIEAMHLFALRPDELEVLVHPQSVIHGMVEFRDGSVVAQLGSPDMRIPIAHCLAWPQRIDGPAARARSGESARTDVRGSRPRALSGLGAGPPSDGNGRGGADGTQCRQRNRGGRIPERPHSIPGDPGAGREDLRRCRRARSAGRTGRARGSPRR